jgi:hypothetical protein
MVCDRFSYYFIEYSHLTIVICFQWDAESECFVCFS